MAYNSKVPKVIINDTENSVTYRFISMTHTNPNSVYPFELDIEITDPLSG